MLLSRHLALLALLFVGAPCATHGLPQAACAGNDITVPVKCYSNGSALAETLPFAYERARAVARLHTPHGTCTGFLVGSEGHLLTAADCITSAEDAASTTYEFGAESASCADECPAELGCGAGSVFRTTAELVSRLDYYPYALVKLETGPDLAQFGFLQVRYSGSGKLYEKVYVPGHPNGYAKRIAAYANDATPATIQGISFVDACARRSLAHTAYTLAGSIGSPVLTWEDNYLVGVNTCAAGCTAYGGYTSATDIRYIVGDLNGKNIRIKDFISAAPTAPPPTTVPPPTTIAPPPTTEVPAPTTTVPPPTTTAPPPTTIAPPPTTEAPPPTTEAPPPTTAPLPTPTAPPPTTEAPPPATTPPPTTTAPPPAASTTAPPPEPTTTRAPGYCQ